jgi:ABC-2 type transport system ATP-binding protein
MNPQFAIQMRDLTKTYGEVTAVAQLSVEIPIGEVFGLLGPNGAGKTTTIRTILTLLKPTSGEVRVWGYDAVTQPRQVRQVLGYVPQEKAVDRFLTGREHLELVAALYHLTPHETGQRIDEVLRLVDLTDKADELVTNYSGGMKKKLDIACGLIGRPKILIMDEPTLGLDVESRIRVWDYVRRLKKDGITVVMTTNYLDEADAVCDRLAIMDRGRLVACGSPDELKRGLGGDRISVRAAATRDQLEAAAEALRRELTFVTGAKVDPKRAELEVRVVSNEQALSPLIQLLQRRQIAIEAISYSRPTLEDVFVTYAGHRIREEGGLS